MPGLYAQKRSGVFGEPFFLFCPANQQSYLKSFHTVLIGWKKPAFQKATSVLDMLTG